VFNKIKTNRYLNLPSQEILEALDPYLGALLAIMFVEAVRDFTD